MAKAPCTAAGGLWLWPKWSGRATEQGEREAERWRSGFLQDHSRSPSVPWVLSAAFSGAQQWPGLPGRVSLGWCGSLVRSCPPAARMALWGLLEMLSEKLWEDKGAPGSSSVALLCCHLLPISVLPEKHWLFLAFVQKASFGPVPLSYRSGNCFPFFLLCCIWHSHILACSARLLGHFPQTHCTTYYPVFLPYLPSA